MVGNCSLCLSSPGIFQVEAASKMGVQASQQVVGHCKSSPPQRSEVRVVEMDMQAALGWGWKQLVGGGAAAARGRVCVQRRVGLWAAGNNSELRKDPAR